MQNIPHFSPEDVKAFLKYEDLVPALEEALADFSKGPEGGVSQPLRATVEVKPFNGFLSAMPAHVSSQGALACKLVSFYPDNASKNVDTHMATILLFDEETGRLKATMDGEVITAMRTAAASVIATKQLAEKHDVLAVLGSGVQAKTHIEAFCKLFPIRELFLWNHRRARAEELAGQVHLSFPDLQVRPCDQVAEAVEHADIIVTATFATEPILGQMPMKPSVHINAVGAPRPHWQELSSELMRSSVIYADSLLSASKESGDVVQSGATVYAEIGEVLLGTKRAEKTRRTVFKSLGLALEDAVSASLVYKAVTEKSNPSLSN